MCKVFVARVMSLLRHIYIGQSLYDHMYNPGVKLLELFLLYQWRDEEFSVYKANKNNKKDNHVFMANLIQHLTTANYIALTAKFHLPM